MKANYKTRHVQYRNGRVELQVYSRSDNKRLKEIANYYCMTKGCGKKIIASDDPKFDRFNVPMYCEECAARLRYSPEENIHKDPDNVVETESSPFEL